MKLNIKSLAVGLILSCASYAEAGVISKSVCSVESLDKLGKPVIDILGSAVGYFNCESLIGATEPKSRVIAYVSEHDYANVSKIFKTQAHVEFEFDGTYAGTLFSYDGKKASHEPLKAVRTGIETHGNMTTLTFRDLSAAAVKNINATFEEVGALDAKKDGISVEISANSQGVGELKLTVLTKDITQTMIASGSILLKDGQAMARDQVEISNKSAFVISNLLIEAGMAVSRGHTPKRPGHYGSFWDYVYMDMDGSNPLFHCANVHSGEIYTKCYIGQMRLK